MAVFCHYRFRINRRSHYQMFLRWRSAGKLLFKYMPDNINTTIKGKYKFVGNLEEFKTYIKSKDGEFIQTTEDQRQRTQLARQGS